jgi:hypothetical protein
VGIEQWEWKTAIKGQPAPEIIAEMLLIPIPDC